MQILANRVSSHLAQRNRLIGSENAFRIAPYIREIEEGGTRVIRCNVGEPDFPLPRHIAEELKRQIDLDQTHYTDPQGVEALREAVARDISATRGIRVTPDRVVVFPGAKPPIGFCQQVYCDPEDEVIYPSPGFPIYESFTRYLGAVPVPMHLKEENGFRCSAADLEALITAKTRLIYLNFPSNPTGGVASAGDLREVAEVILRCAPPDVRVYSDEVYERILFDGTAHSSIASVEGMAERTIIVSGVSKTYGWTGGRVGWAVFPTAEEAVIFRNLNINYFSCVPPCNQYASAFAIDSADSVHSIAKMNDELQRRRDRIVPMLNAIDGISCRSPRGTFYLFPKIEGLCRRLGAIEAWEKSGRELKEATSPSTLVQMFLLFHYGVATLDRRSFGRIGAEGQHYLRISIATSMDDLEEAVERIDIASGDESGFRKFIGEGKHLH